MKTFFAMFAAILCAAAVLWGGYYHFVTKRQAKDSAIVLAMDTIMKADKASTGLDAKDRDFAKIYVEHSIPIIDETIVAVKQALRADSPKSKLRPKVVEIAKRYRIFIADAMDRKRAEANWAEELTHKLEELEALVM